MWELYRKRIGYFLEYFLVPVLTHVCFISILKHLAGREAILSPAVCAAVFYLGLAAMILIPLIKAWTGKKYLFIYAYYGAWILPMAIEVWVMLRFGHLLMYILLGCGLLLAAGWVYLGIKKIGTPDPYECPYCHRINGPHDENCPNCGLRNIDYLKFPEPSKPHPRRRILTYTLIVLIVAIAGVMAVVTFNRLR